MENFNLKMPSKAELVDYIFTPDKITGISEWKTRQFLDNTPLKLGNNGNGRHGIFFGDNRYIWDINRGKHNKVTEIRTNGYSDTYLYGASRPIRADIDKYYKSQKCVHCGSTSDLVTDHKNDLYNDPRVLNIKTQILEDFQCLCNRCNLIKRQVSVKTRKTMKRIGATTIPILAQFRCDFIKGDENYDPLDINAMVGTYWYDPIAFMKGINKKHFKFMTQHFE
jgi:5-methylcytosine-specific restriction endonuclease McrA